MDGIDEMNVLFKTFGMKMDEMSFCIPCQPDKTRYTTRPNWVGPILFIVEITPSLGSPDLGYSQKQNDSDLRTGMLLRSGRAKVMPRR